MPARLDDAPVSADPSARVGLGAQHTQSGADLGLTDPRVTENFSLIASSERGLVGDAFNEVPKRTCWRLFANEFLLVFSQALQL